MVDMKEEASKLYITPNMELINIQTQHLLKNFSIEEGDLYGDIEQPEEE